jgi:GTP1/Obg family GTP-binding protein
MTSENIAQFEHAPAELQAIYEKYQQLVSEVTSIEEMARQAMEAVKRDNALASKQGEISDIVRQITNYVKTLKGVKIGDRILALVEQSKEEPILTENVKKKIQEMKQEAAAALNTYLTQVEPSMQKVQVVTQRILEFPDPSTRTSAQNEEIEKVAATAESFVNDLQTLLKSLKEMVSETIKLSKSTDDLSLAMATGA